MSGFCNFGENELPQTSPCEVDFKAETETEFYWRIHYMEAKVKDMAEWDPAFQRKVDVLCEEHSSDELERAVADLQWEQIGAERDCWDSGLSQESVTRLETLITRILALKCAISRKENEDE